MSYLYVLMVFFFQRVSLVVLWFFFFWFASSQFVVPTYQWYVTDYANVLSSEEKLQLTEKITALQDQTSAEIAVLFVPTINNDEIAFAATQVGQDRGVGKAKEDNGMVILIATEDRQWFIAVWYGLEWTIPDAIAKRIGEKNFPDYFRAGDYAGWVSVALDDISGYILADPSIVSEYTNDKSVEGDDVWWMSILITIIFLLVVWLPKEKKSSSKLIKTWVWVWFVILFSFVIASIALWLLFVSFFGLFFLIKMGPWMYMGGWRNGWFWGWGFGWWGWWFGWFGGWWFGWWWGGGRW